MTREVKRFFEVLKHVDAEAYRVLPESIEEWEKEENTIYKAVTAVLYTYWFAEEEEQPEKTLRELYNGWYGYESPYIFRVEPMNKEEVTITILKKKEGNLYELITNKTIRIPEKFGWIPAVLFP